MDKNSLKIRIILLSFLVSIVLMLIKFSAYLFTHSNSILTDALESIINVVATGFAYYSLQLSAKPKDLDHPYGHGKIEFFASGVEGGLIIIAGIIIFYKSIFSFINPIEIHQLDWGIYLISFTALVNFILGKYLVVQGKKLNTDVLVADGKHLQIDTYSTLGIIIGLILIHFTKIVAIDSIVSIIMALYIIYNGFVTIRPAIAGLMDETDLIVLDKIQSLFIKHCNPQIIDIHNLRIQKYGSELHIDCHATMPYYMSLEKSHSTIKDIEDFLKTELGHDLEIFIHVDPCIPELSCKICGIDDCHVRKYPFERKIDWDINSLMTNKKHTVD